MATPTVDSNQWYQLYVNGNKKEALLGTNLYTGSGTKGAVFFNTTNTTLPGQRWQILPVTVNDTTAYALRCKDGGENAFMGAGFVAAEETEGHTRPQMFRGDIADNGVYWTFGSWGDGTWWLANGANTTSYHLNKKANGLLALSSNISAPQNGQRWSYTPIARIDDAKYSSVNLLGATAIASTTSRSSTTASTSPSSSPTSTAPSSTTSPSSSSSKGISTGAKAGIGAAVGGSALLAIILIALYFWKRKKERRAVHELPNETQQPYGASAKKHELHHDGQTKYEMMSPPIVEAPDNVRPVELPGHAIEAPRQGL